MTQSMVAISQSDCTGCDQCITHCPFEALLPALEIPPGMSKRPIIVVESRCVGCLSCIGSCPTIALHELVVPPIAIESPLKATSGPVESEKIVRWGKYGLGVA